MVDTVASAIAILVISSGIRALSFSWNLCIFNMIIIGLISWGFVLLIYIHAGYVIDMVIYKTFLVSLVPLLTSNSHLIINIIASIGAILCIVLSGLVIRLNWFSKNYDKYLEYFKYNDALIIAKKRLSFLYRFYGLHSITSAALIGLARFYEELGKDEEVEQLYLEGLKILSEGLFLHTNRRLSIKTRVNLYISLSDFYCSRFRFDEAITYCKAAIGLLKIKKDDAIYMAMAQQSMAFIYISTGQIAKSFAKFARARDLYKQILRKSKFVKSKLSFIPPFYVKFLPILFFTIIAVLPILFSSLRTQIYFIFEISLAAVLFTSNLIAEKIIENDTRISHLILNYSSLLEIEGGFYLQLGDYNRAEQIYTDIVNKISSTNINFISEKLTIARNHSNQAFLQMNKGNYGGCSLKEKIEHYKNSVSMFDNAISIYTSIFDFASPFVPLECRSRYIGCVLERNIIYAQLVGIEIYEDELYNISSDISKILISPKQHMMYATFLIKIGSLFYLAYKYTQAETQYSYANEILMKLPGCNFSAKSELGLSRAFLAVATDSATVALEHFRESNIMAHSIFLDCLTVVSEKYKIELLHKNRFFLNSYASFIYKYYQTSSLIVGELFDLVLRNKSLTTEVLTVQKKIINNRLLHKYSDELRIKYNELIQLRRIIAHKMLVSTASDNYDALQKLNSRKEELEEVLAREIAEFDLETSLKTVNRHLICKKLPPNSVIIEVLLVDLIEFIPNPHHLSNSQSHYFAFIIHSDEPDNTKLIDLGNAKEIDKLISMFRLQILSRTKNISADLHDRKMSIIGNHISDNNTDIKNSGIALRKMIFDPLISNLSGRKRIFIAPDSNLTQIPYEVLPTNEGKQLIDIYTISYLSTARDILRFGFANNSTLDSSLVIADPDFNYGADSDSYQDITSIEEDVSKLRGFNISNIYFERLPGTRDEGEAIANLLNGVSWTGEKALKRNVLEFIQSPFIFHIATHGIFIQTQTQTQNKNKNKNILNIMSGVLNNYYPSIESAMLSSCLALAGANWKNKCFMPHPNAGNGILTAEEISTLYLSSTELVVLSACDTGRGEVLVGEGVYGLRRAFMLAGAKTLIMSLWQVPDIQTKDLMINLYNRLINGETRVDSLRNSQLDIRDKYPDTYFWGAFICQGDPGSLNGVKD